eukprot:TRINITY_DN30100_c0_g1_i1.p1 TRINITY_DN30100_c0_g1~~TRINITY_DN30100_c0_g1_i1.p1  ORF type:complete len:385 (+),score=117.88 TRINITY_DN30100_c0_g1_i1:75-1229(+)
MVFRRRERRLYGVQLAAATAALTACWRHVAHVEKTAASNGGAAEAFLGNGGSLPRRDLVTVASLVAAGGAGTAWPALVAAAGRPEPSEEEKASIRNAMAVVDADPARPGAAAQIVQAEEDLGKAIARYEGPLQGTLEERSRLRLARAKARITQNEIAGGQKPEKAAEAVDDFDVAIGLMKEDMKRNSGKPMYFEYPDALVQRGLANEEVKRWSAAVKDYTTAIDIWRKEMRPDRPGDLGVNPLVLNYRGNALAQLERFDEAVEDYSEAGDIFASDGERRQASISYANEALALYGGGNKEEAAKRMQKVIRNDPGVTDMHVALAAVFWEKEKYGPAEEEWKFACENIDTGCQKYKDLEWVTNIRRWPQNLVAALAAFLKGKAMAV